MLSLRGKGDCPPDLRLARHALESALAQNPRHWLSLERLCEVSVQNGNHLKPVLYYSCVFLRYNALHLVVS